jgi:MFS family permease
MRAVLRRRKLRRFITARFFSAMAMMLQRATLAWQIFDQTHSPFYLGLMGLVQFAPAIPVGLWAGAFADAHERLRIVRAAQAVGLVLALVLCGASAADRASLPLLFATILAAAIAWTFESPAGAALLPTLVPREQFTSAVTLQATFRNIAWGTGPMLAGLAIHARGVAASYAIGAALLAASLLALRGVSRTSAAPGGRAVTWAAVREGIDFVRTRPVLLAAMALDMIAVIFASVTALLPVFASEILHVGPRGYGLLAGSLQIGAFVMTLILAACPPMQRHGRALLGAVAAFGVATVLFGLSREFLLSVAALVLAGMADEVSVVARQTIVQLATPDALRGRVSAVNLVFIGASNQLGDVESGFVASLVGATVTAVFGGVACLAALAVVAARVPALRSYRPLDHGPG